MNTKQTGQFIAKKRKDKKMTQNELAELLQVTDKAISRWETGEGYPEVTILPKLAYTLGVTVDELLSGDQAEVCETTSVKIVSQFEMLSRISLSFILFGLFLGIGMIYLNEDKFQSLIPLAIGWFIGFVVYQYSRYTFIKAAVYNDLDKFVIYKQSKLQIIALISSVAIVLPQFVLKYIIDEMGYGWVYPLDESYLNFISFLWSSMVSLVLSMPISLIMIRIYKSVTYKHESIVNNPIIFRSIMAALFLFVFIFFGILVYDFVWGTIDRLMFFIPIVILLPNIYLAIVDVRGVIGLLLSIMLSIGLVLTGLSHDGSGSFDHIAQFIEYFDYSFAFFFIALIGSGFMMIYELKTEKVYNERFFSHFRTIIMTITFVILFLTYSSRAMHAYPGFITIPAILIGFSFEILFRYPKYIKHVFNSLLIIALIGLSLSITQPTLFIYWQKYFYIWDVVKGFEIPHYGLSIDENYFVLIPPIGLLLGLIIFGINHFIIKPKTIHLILNGVLFIGFFGLTFFTFLLSYDFGTLIERASNTIGGFHTGGFLWMSVGVLLSILVWIDTALCFKPNTSV